MSITVTEADGTTWRAPFCANEVENVTCPACDAETVRVREDSSADPRPAYCGTCHALLEVRVFETYGEPEVVDHHE
jgi:hypothetical protein